MMFTSNIKKIREAVQAAFNELEAIETEAAQLRATISAYEDARQHNHSVATRRAALESARDALKGEYAEASFEGDTGRLTAAQTQRTEIDKELLELASVEVVKPDGYAMADLTYTIGEGVKFPYFGSRPQHGDFGIMQDLYDEIDGLRTEHHRRKYAAIDNFGKYITSDDDHAVKMERDGSYRKRQRVWAEREQERKDENIRLYDTEEPNFTNTDELQEAMDRAKAKRREQVSA